MTPALSIEALQSTLDTLAAHGGNQTQAATALGLSRGALQSRLRTAALRGLTGGIPAAAIPPEGFEVSRVSRTLDADGEIVRQSVRTSPAAGPAFEMPATMRIAKQTVQVGPQKQIEREWIKLREDAIGHGLVEGLQAAFAAYTGAAPAIVAPSGTSDETLTMIPLADLHVGMYADARETGDDYDVKIATSLVKDTVSTLVAKGEPSKRAIVLGLGDYFHMNDQKNVTPGSGHRLDVDGRWGQVFTAGAKLMTHVVDQVAQKHEIVDVVLLPGNHDEDAAICLRVALSLFYSKSPGIRVYDGAGLHWFDRFGACLFGATHGHTMKPERMAMLMATERAKDWGETVHRYMKFGHIHHATLRDVAGVQVESHTTPAPKDAWAAGGGYVSKRSMCGITYHREFGECGRNTINLMSQPRQVAA